jgi:2-polyprenyl-3-methyl-5-hydroxy-6-metoxy-1,4-benzoquinol methylase
MDMNYWNNFAHKYDDMVIDAFTYDRSNIVSSTLEHFASPDLVAGDFGCGPGKLLPWLAKKYQKVYGYDFSNKLLRIARKRCKGLENIIIRNADLSQPVDRIPMVDVAVSLNAALMPDTDLRLNFLRGLASRIRAGGHLVMSVPSMESILYDAFRETEWYRKDGYTTPRAEKYVDVSCLTRPRMLAQGVLCRGTEPTKHYLREELIVLVRDEMKLDLLDIVKVEYDWEVEMENDQVPDWMGEPFPWDWLVIAKSDNTVASY